METSHIFYFYGEDFNSKNPDFELESIDGEKNIYFNTQKIKILLPDNKKRTVLIKITDFSNNFDMGYIHFKHDGDVKISLDNPNYFDDINLLTFKPTSYTGFTYYVRLNYTEIKNDEFDIFVAVGKNNNVDENFEAEVTITYDCEPYIEYEIDAGLHVYSPYDAIYENAKLQTKLVSRVDPNNWELGTVVWYKDGTMALPYYYGVGDYVYKIGTELDRSYGTKTEYYYQRGVGRKRFKISSKMIGPKLFENVFQESVYWTHSTPNPDYYNFETSEVCIVFQTFKHGIITEIYHKDDLIMPDTYRYYLGAVPPHQNKVLSNDSIFTTYDNTYYTFFPITGFYHIINMYKINQGHRFFADKTLRVNQEALIKLIASVFIAVFAWYLLEVFNLTGVILKAWAKAKGWVKWIFGGPNKPSAGLQVIGGTSADKFTIPFLVPLPFLIDDLFDIIKTYNENPCKIYLHHFTDKPYIDINDTLYRDDLKTIDADGYYCDGVYFYKQEGGVITEKELSYTDMVIAVKPIVREKTYSLMCDTPTKPEYILDIDKLILLPYTSGRPLPFCTYTNDYMSHIVTGLCTCDFEIEKTDLIEIKEGTIFSCISKEDANRKALMMLEEAVLIANANSDYSEIIEDELIGEIETYFTHEIKIENTPNEAVLFYDKRLWETPIIGTTLYYDYSGCYKVLNGYYSISDNTYYRIFLHTTNGNIDEILYMEEETSTHTTTNEEIKTDNLNYTSNWYLTNISETTLFYFIVQMYLEKCFDINTLYTSGFLAKGFINSRETLQDFKLYNDFETEDYDEANEAYYIGLIDWDLDEIFYYTKNKTIYLDLEQLCPNIPLNGVLTGSYIAANFGFKIKPRLNGNYVSTETAVNLTVNLYNSSEDLIDTYTFYTDVNKKETYIPFRSNIPLINDITNIVIESINTPNPDGKVTYEIGDYDLCSYVPISPTPTPTMTPTPINNCIKPVINDVVHIQGTGFFTPSCLYIYYTSQSPYCIKLEIEAISNFLGDENTYINKVDCGSPAQFCYNGLIVPNFTIRIRQICSQIIGRSTIISTSDWSDPYYYNVPITPTPTPTITLTPTPTSLLPLSCNNTYTYNNVSGFYEFDVSLGSETGFVYFGYGTTLVPTRFKLEYDDVEIFDSKFIGSSNYNSQLFNLGYTIDDLNTSNNAPYSGITKFSKTSGDPDFVRVYVEAPLSNTTWKFRPTCPFDLKDDLLFNFEFDEITGGTLANNCVDFPGGAIQINPNKPISEFSNYSYGLQFTTNPNSFLFSNSSFYLLNFNKNDFTISMSFQILQDRTSHLLSFVGYNNNGTLSYLDIIIRSNKSTYGLEFRYKTRNETERKVIGSVIKFNTWSNITVRLSRPDVVTRNMAIFLNGVRLESSIVPLSSGEFDFNKLVVGARHDGKYPFVGVIGRLSYWNRPLDEYEMYDMQYFPKTYFCDE